MSIYDGLNWDCPECQGDLPLKFEEIDFEGNQIDVTLSGTCKVCGKEYSAYAVASNVELEAK